MSAVTIPNIPSRPSTCDRTWQWKAHTPGGDFAFRTTKRAKPYAGHEPPAVARVGRDELLMEVSVELRPQAGHRLKVVELGAVGQQLL